VEPPPETAPRFNVAPGQDVLVVRATREVASLRWGLVPAWADDPKIGHRLVNARAESLAVKPAFRDALRLRRCLVVADGFYEWAGARAPRRPHWFHRRDGAPFAIAGLWERWTPRGDSGAAPLESCTLVTTDANATVAAVHDRMPVLIAPEDFGRWLGEDAGASVESAAALLRPCPDDWLAERAVGPRVNDARVDEPACLEPPAPELF
jgi:putative SOS response-associated peptidase YedK